MEWVETTAKTVEEAKDQLLDQLGVDEQEAEFDVLEEPRPGMFGRLRGMARVRARVAPKAPRQKEERRRRSASDRPKKKKGEGTATSPSDDAEGPSSAPIPAPRTPKKERPPKNNRSNAESSDEPRGPALSVEDASADVTEFLEEFVKRMGIDATTSIDVSEEGELLVSLNGDNLGRLIGPRGGMMTALEELCRTRLQHRAAGGDRPRLRLDVGGYREARRENLRELVETTVAAVRDSGTPHVIDVVTAGERKVIHDYISENADGVTTSSEGEDPVRRVVISTE